MVYIHPSTCLTFIKRLCGSTRHQRYKAKSKTFIVFYMIHIFGLAIGTMPNIVSRFTFISLKAESKTEKHDRRQG
ncbi:hypothetical protein BD408DRAFT_411058 [Parasitella parasitica]|nr:hypothetical protein BD408DRAFT_411058 [Parasitella parasitica]